MAVTITVVGAPGCHFCADARAALAGFGRDYELEVDEVEVDSDTGAELVARHRPVLFPLVVVDGVFFSAGRLPQGKLRALLDARLAAGARR